MNPNELPYMSAEALVAAYRTRVLSPVEVVEAVLRRIETVDQKLNAYCFVTADTARQAAKDAEAQMMRREPLGLLHGVPVSIKDLLITRDAPTRRGSRLYADAGPTEDAPVVERLRAAGAIVVGKTNTPEFGWKGVTDNALTGATRNPWDLSRSPGGSSGGAAAAAAAGMGPIGVGTDGGGSIRIPGSFSGVFGIKPTFGRVPTYPPSAAEPLAHTGPLTRTVRDSALALQVMAGPDERDRNTFPADATDFLAGIGGGIAGARVAWSPDLGYAVVDPEVAAICAAAAARLAEAGAVIEAAHPGFADPARPWGLMFWGGIGAMLHRQPEGWRELIDPGLRDQVDALASASVFDLADAFAARAALWETTRRFFDSYEFLVTPTMAVPAFSVGLNTPTHIGDRPINTLSWSPFTYPFNMTGNPAVTVPCGFTDAGLPVGLQIVGRRFDDAGVLRAAATLEAIAPWAGRRPPVD